MAKAFPSAASIRSALAPTEAEVKRGVCDWLSLHKYHWIRVQSGSIPAVYGGKQRRINCAPNGTADLLVILPPNGYALWVEVKRNHKSSRQSPEQKEFAEKMAALGAGYRLVRSVDEMPRVMAEEVHSARAGFRLNNGAVP